MDEPTSNRLYPHLPVLYHDIIHALRPCSPGYYVDVTVGAGGHAWGILEASSPDGCLLGLDLDPQALAIASQRLSVFGKRVELIQASYVTLRQQMERIGWQSADGIVFDLGLSSMQLDTPERGFSFQSNAPLDMRFNPGQVACAADVLNQLSENELADVLWKFGEERYARRIAHAICKARPLTTTYQLAELVEKTVGGRRGSIHPATRTFQALRIMVNQELEALEIGLPEAVAALKPGGRLAVISFHSLEDRIVKQYFQRESRDCICPPKQPICTCQHKACITLINAHPIQSTGQEIINNPRARSARLRIVEKLNLA